MSELNKTGNQFKVLLVENSRTARTILLRQLQSQGYEVEVVGSGVEAIEAILHSDFHLVIMDVFLPQMNGYEAATKIRSLEGDKANLILIALTSSTNERDKKICLEAGMNHYILKSDENGELLFLLDRYKKEFFSSSHSIQNSAVDKKTY